MRKINVTHDYLVDEQRNELIFYVHYWHGNESYEKKNHPLFTLTKRCSKSEEVVNKTTQLPHDKKIMWCEVIGSFNRHIGEGYYLSQFRLEGDSIMTPIGLIPLTTPTQKRSA